MTSAVGTSGTAITSRVHSLNRPNMVSVGTIVWLSSELMFFAGLFAMAAVFTLVNEGFNNWQSMWTCAVYLLLGLTLWQARGVQIPK